MSNAYFAKGAERILKAALAATAPVAGTLKVALMKSAYTPSLSSHEFYSDISANVLGTPQALSSPTFTGGVMDAADPTFPSVTTGNTVNALVLYMDTGVAGTSWLIAYLDTVTGFPLSTNGGDVTPEWDNGTYKILALV